MSREPSLLWSKALYPISERKPLAESSRSSDARLRTKTLPSRLQRRSPGDLADSPTVVGPIWVEIAQPYCRRAGTGLCPIRQDLLIFKFCAAIDTGGSAGMPLVERKVFRLTIDGGRGGRIRLQPAAVIAESNAASHRRSIRQVAPHLLRRT